MTVINHKAKQLQIIIASNSPQEHKEVFMQALTACVRWYSNIEEGDIRTKNDEDAINLSSIARLLKCFISTEAASKGDELKISVPSIDPVEQKQSFIKALVACVRWYGCAPRMKIYDDNEDGQYLIDVSELLSALTETKEN